jgi:hypothetical protein
MSDSLAYENAVQFRHEQPIYLRYIWILFTVYAYDS